MLEYLKKYWIYTLLAPLFMILEVSMDLLQPSLMSRIVDDGVLGLNNDGVGDINLIISLGLQMIGLITIGGITGILSGAFSNLCGQQFGNDLRKDCFKKIMSFSFEQTDKFSIGSLITRITNDVTQIQNLVVQALRGFVRNFMFLFGGFYCMLKLNPKFGIMTGCVVPIVILIVVLFMSKANPIFFMLQQKLDRVNNIMEENITGVRVVKAYVKEHYEKKRFSNANDDLINTQLKILILFSHMMPIINIIMNILVVSVIYVGSIQVQVGTMSPGNIMAGITYISQILNGLGMLVMIFQTVSRGTASAKRLQEVLDCEPTIKDGTFKEIPSEIGTIEFRNVSFAYPNGSGEKVLNNINLTVYSGETLGILGTTGSSKTSLISLIPRFFDAIEGEVLVDGINVKEYPLETLRDKIAIALQKSELFNMTIRENIMWGNQNATEEQILEATEIAQADEFISLNPCKYDTIVAQKGMNLSGGQKQRIAISRAILKDAEILIFDDATSALDLKTEAKLYDALERKNNKVTRIIIAQRIASVKNADRIAVLDGGILTACDTHENLMKTSEIYQNIYYSQLKKGVNF